ncbi:hypothetical protein FB451DRAFT_1248429 [Mycena latifolia]|nr:hypothetical protein FB451DRAFT_1248429 [Mycena latifolia]
MALLGLLMVARVRLATGAWPSRGALGPTIGAINHLGNVKKLRTYCVDARALRARKTSSGPECTRCTRSLCVCSTLYGDVEDVGWTDTNFKKEYLHGSR